MFKFSGGAISWRSKRQDTTVHSSPEAEYIPMLLEVREAVCMKRMWSEVSAEAKVIPTVIFGDKHEAMELV